MKPPSKILVIAGSDSGAGAGIQADIKTISAFGVYATTAITSITAQNTLGVQAVFDVPVNIIKAQIESVLSDIGADVIKTGMLNNKENINLVANIVSKHRLILVLDPVMLAKGGAKLLRDDAMAALKKLIPLATLLTPNIPEAEILAGMKIKNETDMEAAAKKILKDFGCKAVLIKGGHLTGTKLVDVLVKPKHKTLKLTAKKINTKNTHGTGCTYASAIAAGLAKGEGLEMAVKNAHKYLQQAIKNSVKIGKGHSPVGHFLN